MMRKRSYTAPLLVAALIAVALWVSPHLALAQPRYITHKVAKGDTLELLAAEYYGDRRHAVFIMVANQMTHARPLKPGEVIKIPVGKDVTSEAGDTFETLAAEYLGDERRAEFLASFNMRSLDQSIAAGEEIRIPLSVTHKAAGREQLSVLAATYLGDRKQAGFLRKYNFLDKDVLEPGESIVIPIQHIRVRRSKLPAPDEESTARLQRRRAMQEAAQQVLPTARAAWRAGDYALVRRELSKIDTDYLDSDWAAEIGVLLGATYIAFDDAPSALATFRRVLTRQPQHTLSRYEYSPKICEVWERAGGKVEAAQK